MCVHMHISCCKYTLYGLRTLEAQTFHFYASFVSFVLFSLEYVRLSVCDELAELDRLKAVVIFHTYYYIQIHSHTSVLVRCEHAVRLLWDCRVLFLACSSVFAYRYDILWHLLRMFTQITRTICWVLSPVVWIFEYLFVNWWKMSDSEVRNIGIKICL